MESESSRVRGESIDFFFPPFLTDPRKRRIWVLSHTLYAYVVFREALADKKISAFGYIYIHTRRCVCVPKGKMRKITGRRLTSPMADFKPGS